VPVDCNERDWLGGRTPGQGSVLLREPSAKGHVMGAGSGEAATPDAMAGVQSIERAFTVLRELSLGPAGVTDIAERVDLPKSTVSRLLSALEAEGAVAQREVGSDYELGAGLAALADAANNDANMAAVVRPFLIELSEETGEAAGFVVRSGRNVYWVDNVEQDDVAVQVQDRTGFYAPMHSVPAGLALLAHLPANEIESYLAQKLERVNPRTITDSDVLRANLRQIVADGLVWSVDDLGDGLTAIDVPFRGASGQVEGALFVNAPSFRFPDDGDKDRVEALVVDAAQRLSHRFTIH
jgi:DNA-binding IclR family transcriptional regulator